MATFGIEAIRHFNHARAAGVSSAGDLTYTFNRSNGFNNKLKGAGHTRRFYYSDTDCWETDLRDSDQGGDDRNMVDNVDIFWIETHGNNNNGAPLMLYDTPRTQWHTFASQWQLGEATQSEWMMAFSCHTVDRNNVGALWNIFAGLHIYCGAYENMYDGTTTDECGEDVGDNLVDGDTVSEAWIDGVSDWYVDNHPIVVCPANAAVYNGGNIRWDQSYLNRDHLWGHGTTMPDPIPSQQVTLLYRWSEG